MGGWRSGGGYRQRDCRPSSGRSPTATLVSIDAGTVYGLVVQMMGVIFMIYVGMGTATSVRVAERFGRCDAVGVREASRLGVVASVLLGLLMAIGLGFRPFDSLRHIVLTLPLVRTTKEQVKGWLRA